MLPHETRPPPPLRAISFRKAREAMRWGKAGQEGAPRDRAARAAGARLYLQVVAVHEPAHLLLRHHLRARVRVRACVRV